MFVGDLHMELQGGIFGSNVVSYDMNNIGVAQGNSGSTNYWWFGGQDCVFQEYEGNVVRCIATGPSGYQLYLYFRRGNGNPVDTIDCYKLEIPNFQMFNVVPEFVGENCKVTQGWLDRGGQVKMPPYVTYYSDQQSETLKLSVKDNLLYNSINNHWVLFDTSYADPTTFSEGVPVAIWVLASDGQLYASRQNKLCMLQHSSLLGGRPVAGAGEMSVLQGVIQWANNASGQYRPEDSVTRSQLTESLVRQGYEQTFAWHSVLKRDLKRMYFGIDDVETE
jgi:hypothetical protein